MTKSQRTRGAHPGDEGLFAEEYWPELQAATHDLSWLLTRDYSDLSATKLVGDRYLLRARQRLAVQRSACSDQSLKIRNAKSIAPPHMAGASIDVDAFNLLLTIEAALGGGTLIRGRDGCCRDMSSIHGSYRKVIQTVPAIKAIGEYFEDCQVASARWFIDRPVSNSGRLSAMLLELAKEHSWDWTTEVIYEVDQQLIASDRIVASADSIILDHCQAWANIASAVVDKIGPPIVVPMYQLSSS